MKRTEEEYPKLLNLVKVVCNSNVVKNSELWSVENVGLGSELQSHQKVKVVIVPKSLKCWSKVLELELF